RFSREKTHFGWEKSTSKKIDGEVWMVHGGNFYHVEKRKFGPGEMPKNLHWFKWEATLTWLSGYVLLVVVYYLSGGAYLIEPARNPLHLTNGSAVLLGSAVIFGGWFLYDGIFKLPWSQWTKNIIAVLFLVVLTYGLSHAMAGRGFFMHMGAMLGTCMILNVWRHILPNQQAIIEASDKGLQPNYNLGIKAKARSMHNSYMTLPVLFVMISNHFGNLYGHSFNWLVLLLMILLGATVRHGMITESWKPAIPALGILILLGYLTLPGSIQQLSPSVGSASTGSIVHMEQINHLIQTRCVSCHSEFPTDEVFRVAPNGIKFDHVDSIRNLKDRIYQRVVVQKTMPLQNKTQMTDEERSLVQSWVEQQRITHE
ncbi:MAG TPA: urate hydroxylase PuuD, partial [Pseudobdellovibrionaceae bacterium]|nr:urate hydroxylase PuuD [Pseudobdellovibrionaceae bacterium]